MRNTKNITECKIMAKNTVAQQETKTENQNVFNEAMQALANGVRASAEVQVSSDANGVLVVEKDTLQHPQQQRRNNKVAERKVVIFYSKELKAVYLSCWLDMAMLTEAGALKLFKQDAKARQGLHAQLGQATDLQVAQGQPWRASLSIAQQEKAEMAAKYEGAGWHVVGNSKQKERLVIAVEEYKAGAAVVPELA
jgi:hypothetical protein